MGRGIGGVVFGIRYARGAYAGSMVGWVSVGRGGRLGMRVAGLGCGKKGGAGAGVRIFSFYLAAVGHRIAL